VNTISDSFGAHKFLICTKYGRTPSDMQLDILAAPRVCNFEAMAHGAEMAYISEASWRLWSASSVARSTWSRYALNGVGMAGVSSCMEFIKGDPKADFMNPTRTSRQAYRFWPFWHRQSHHVLRWRVAHWFQARACCTSRLVRVSCSFDRSWRSWACSSVSTLLLLHAGPCTLLHTVRGRVRECGRSECRFVLSLFALSYRCCSVFSGLQYPSLDG
jgi:hypothetical protein